MGETKSNNITETKLKKVAQLSGKNPEMVFMGLMPHVNRESLTRCFHELDERKAVCDPILYFDGLFMGSFDLEAIFMILS